MRVILDGAGRVLACGGDTLAAGDGETVAETARTLADYRAADEAGKASGQPYDVTYDGAAFGWRARAKLAAELDEDERQALIASLQAALDGWGGLTAAQKDGKLRDMARGVLRALRRGL